jgi:endoglucanase
MSKPPAALRHTLMLPLLALAPLLLAPLSVSAAVYEVIEGRIHRNGSPITLFGVNWFGAETLDHVPHGLWARNYRSMIEQIAQSGFNAVRVPICPTTLDDVPPTSIDYSKNPGLQGLGSLQVLDQVLAEMDRQGLYILLDHHRPDCRAISQLWYTDDYSEQDWISDLRFLADRYRGLEHFVGIDLKNEPHGAATWGTGNLATDWNLAAERAAAAVLEINPDLLIFVEGVGDNPVCSSNTNHWWGGNLEPQACAPLAIAEEKLVFSPHVYGPDVFAQPYFSDPTFPANMPAIWDQHFGFLADQGRILAPGEFGGRYGHGGNPADVLWQNALIDYFIDKRICDVFYWSWNPNSGDTGGMLRDDWTSVWEDKLENLSRLKTACAVDAIPACSDGLDNDDDGLIDLDDPGCANAEDGSEYNAPPDGGPPGGGAEVELVTQSDWGTGYCAEGIVTNTAAQPINWQVQITVDGQIQDFWNGRYSVVGDQIEVAGADWNAELAGGEQTAFGFCAERGATTPPPPPPSACVDGRDNDGDGLIDLADPGCESATDDDEYDPPNGGGLRTELAIQSDWGSGYCADVQIQNQSAQAIDWLVQINIEGVAENVWNAIAQQQGSVLSLEGVDWNNLVAPGAQVQSVGFCASR